MCGQVSQSLTSTEARPYSVLCVHCVILVHLAGCAFLIRLNFALHKPMFLLATSNALLHTICGRWSSHYLVLTLFCEMLW